MKKFLVLASVLLVFVMIFAACGGKENPTGTEEQTTAVIDPATDAPTEAPTEPGEEPTEAPTQEPETNEPETNEPATNEPETNEPETNEPETLPYVEPTEAGMVGKAIDVFAVNNLPYTLDDTRTVSFKTGDPIYPIALMGWIGFGQAIDSYGYFINDGEFVYDAAYLTEVPADDPVRAAGNGGDLATRFGIIVPTSAFSVGENKVGFVVKLADGTVVLIDAFVTVNVEKTAWSGSGIVIHQSFDQLYFGTGDAGNGPENIFTPGQSAGWDYIVNCDFSVDTLTYWGWVGYMGELGQFGYQVNGGEAIYDAAWAHETGADVIGAAQGSGADSGNRMKIAISLAGIGGEGNVITVLYKDSNGAAVILGEFTVNRKIDDYTVPQENWVISGHRPGIQDSTDGMVAAGGVASGALLHQGSIYLGEIDLSKYSKVVIYWGCDNSPATIERYEANANNRIMLLNAEMVNVTTPADGTIIAGSTYELKGWAVTPIEIDLTGIDYNGPVYVAIDTLPGTFALFSEVTFVGLTEDPNYQPEDNNVVIDLSTIEGYKDTNQFGYDCPIIDIGYDQVYLVGEFDLNNYSQIIIEYSYDGDTPNVTDRTPEQCWTDCGRYPIIGFTALNKCFGYANVVNQDAIELGIYTEMTYTPGNWAAATRTAVIDIPVGIGYSGPCYLSALNPWGRGIAVVSITLVPRA